jgi:hypothetical protein
MDDDDFLKRSYDILYAIADHCDDAVASDYANMMLELRTELQRLRDHVYFLEHEAWVAEQKS